MRPSDVQLCDMKVRTFLKSWLKYSSKRNGFLWRKKTFLVCTVLCIQVACNDWCKAYCKICETQFVLTSFLCYHSKILFWKETWTVKGLKIWDVVKYVCLAQGVPINRGIQWRFWNRLCKWLIELVWLVMSTRKEMHAVFPNTEQLFLFTVAEMLRNIIQRFAQ